MATPTMKIHKYLSFCLMDLTLLYLSVFSLITLAATDYNISSDKLLLNCGSAESSSFNGKNWTGDVGSKYLSSDHTNTSTLSIATNPSVPKVPYSTACIFHSHFTYSFPTSTPGDKFIRLYFYSAPHSTPNLSKDYFSVVAGGITLLANFSPSANVKSDYLINKDFTVHIKELELNITFIPSPVASHADALAFVNGIEIFSLPSNLYKNVPLPVIGQSNRFIIPDEMAFEMLYRVSVQKGGAQVSNVFGVWSEDSDYKFGPESGTDVHTDICNIIANRSRSEYAAPVELYASANTMSSIDAININQNLSWALTVDSGFRYFIRLHFSEIQITKVNERVFKVYINNQLAESSIDLVALEGSPFGSFLWYIL